MNLNEIDSLPFSPRIDTFPSVARGLLSKSPRRLNPTTDHLMRWRHTHETRLDVAQYRSSCLSDIGFPDKEPACRRRFRWRQRGDADDRHLSRSADTKRHEKTGFDLGRRISFHEFERRPRDQGGADCESEIGCDRARFHHPE